MKAVYREFEGASFDAENVIESSETSIYLDGDTAQEILESADNTQLGTNNYSDVNIGSLWIRYGKNTTYWIDNGVDIIRATKERALLIISNRLVD